MTHLRVVGPDEVPTGELPALCAACGRAYRAIEFAALPLLDEQRAAHMRRRRQRRRCLCGDVVTAEPSELLATFVELVGDLDRGDLDGAARRMNEAIDVWVRNGAVE